MDSPPAAPEEGDEDKKDLPKPFKYRLGTDHFQDMAGGDAGCLMKKAANFPFIDFVRSQFCGRHKNSILHSDVGVVIGNAK